MQVFPIFNKLDKLQQPSADLGVRHNITEHYCIWDQILDQRK